MHQIEYLDDLKTFEKNYKKISLFFSYKTHLMCRVLGSDAGSDRCRDWKTP
mgnify:CR=1 FL=1